MLIEWKWGDTNIVKFIRKFLGWIDNGGIAQRLLTRIVKRLYLAFGSGIDSTKGTVWPNILCELTVSGKGDELVYGEQIWEKDNGWKKVCKFIDPWSSDVLRILQGRWDGVYMHLSNGKTKGVGRTHRLLLKNCVPIYGHSNTGNDMGYRKIMRTYSLDWSMAIET